MRRLTWSTALLCSACFQPSDLTSIEDTGSTSGDATSNEPTTTPTTDVTSSPSSSSPSTTEADSSTSDSNDPTGPTEPTGPSDTTADDSSTSDPTGPETTTGEPVIECDDGIEVAGELCLGGAELVTEGDIVIDARLARIDDDDVADLVYLNSDSLYLLLGVGDGTFGPSLFRGTMIPTAAEVGDIDGDNNIDVVTVNDYDGTMSVALGDGEGNFDVDPVNYAFESLPTTLAIYDLDGEQGADVLVGLGSGLSVFLSDGAGFPANNGGFGSTGGMRSIFGGNFDGDGDPDVAYIRVTVGGPAVEMRLGNGDGTFSSLVQVDHEGNDPRAVTSGDFDGDGNVDLAYIDATADALYVQLGNGAAGFAAATASATDDSPSRLVAVDLTGDGVLDIAVGHAGANTVWAFANDGTGAFADPLEIGVAAPVDALVYGFANADGVPDLVATNTGGALISLVLSNP